MKRFNKYTFHTLNDSGALAFGSKKAILFSVFFFLMGISTGAFLEVTMTVSEKNNLALSLQQYLYTETGQADFSNPFFASVSNNLVLLLIIFLAGLSILGFPVAFASIFYKGMGLGFSTGLILETMNAKGILVILSTLVPQNVLLIPALVLATAAAANYAILSLGKKRHPQKKSLKQSSKSFILLNISLAVIVVVACIIEGLIYLIAP